MEVVGSIVFGGVCSKRSIGPVRPGSHFAWDGKLFPSCPDPARCSAGAEKAPGGGRTRRPDRPSGAESNGRRSRSAISAALGGGWWQVTCRRSSPSYSSWTVPGMLSSLEALRLRLDATDRIPLFFHSSGDRPSPSSGRAHGATVPPRPGRCQRSVARTGASGDPRIHPQRGNKWSVR